MQVNKLHSHPHDLSAPKHRGIHDPSAETNKADGPHFRSVPTGHGYADRLQRTLQDVPEVRTDVIEAARLKVSKGEYTTREAAIQTAASILDH